VLAGVGGSYVIGGAEPAPSPWLQELVDQYYASAQANWPWGRLSLIAVALSILGAIPMLLPHLDRAAYPAELERQHALETCSRADPAFVQFFKADRDACYRRVLIGRVP